MISQRSKLLFAKPSAIFASHRICFQDLYHKYANPDGYINLGTAENRLVWDLLGPRLNSASESVEADSHYGPPHGHPLLHRALAGFLGRSFNVQLDPNGVIIANGATAIIDMLGYALCEADEAFLVPAPYYPGFDDDLAGRSRVHIVPAPLRSRSNFRIERESLKMAWDAASANGIKIRALLITSPSNPLGRVLDDAEIFAAIAFGREKKIHVVFDEIYAHSRFPDVRFSSVLNRMVDERSESENVHVIYGMAKDFSLAGYRIGAFYSHNDELLGAMRKLSYFASTSMSNQRQVARLLEDTEWVDHFLMENRRRLQSAYSHLVASFAPICEMQGANAGVFAWISLAQFMDEVSFDGERRLHQRIMQDAKVNILPGEAFHCGEPGWFRVCYANDPQRISIAALRLRRVLVR